MSQLISASGLGQPRRCYVDQGEPLQHDSRDSRSASTVTVFSRLLMIFKPR